MCDYLTFLFVVLTPNSSDTRTFFGVDWFSSDTEIKTFLSAYASTCISLGCFIDSLDGLCQCPVVVESTMAFESDSDVVSIDTILTRAKIGAFKPTIAGEDVSGTTGIKKYPVGALTPETVFEFTDKLGRTLYRKNLVSKVVIGNGALLMRNPVTFYTLSEFTERDAQYELDAALEHYFYHSNAGMSHCSDVGIFMLSFPIL
jgi:hypothetical protein